MSNNTMTAEQAWAEVDRLDVESDAAGAVARAAIRKSDALIKAWLAAESVALAIGPRSAKVPS